jgi:hypothetical protein
MIGYLVLGIIAVVVLYAADRLIKARTQNRRLRRMNERLTAAAVKTERQQAQRQASAAASAELTSIMPAIKNPAVNNPVLAPAAETTGETPQVG